jgi:hypothetical protein
MTFSHMGWFTLEAVRQRFGEATYDKLRRAIANVEIRVTHVGDEYLIADEDLREWQAKHLSAGESSSDSSRSTRLNHPTED